MDNKNYILIGIVVLVIALIAVGAYISTNNDHKNVNITSNTTDVNDTNTTDVIMIDKDGKVQNSSVVGDNSPRNDTNKTNQTFRVYNPQTDSYVTVIGEGYDAEVDRWYTYDTDGVRYYNTRAK